MNKITKKNVNFVGTNLKTLKLDLTYRPIEVIDSIEALVLCLVGKAIAVEEYENTIRSPSSIFQLPSVIVLKNLVKYRITTTHCTRENIMTRDKYTCQYCGAKATQVHHERYAKYKIGKEPIKWLVSLCKPCHDKQH